MCRTLQTIRRECDDQTSGNLFLGDSCLILIDSLRCRWGSREGANLPTGTPRRDSRRPCYGTHPVPCACPCCSRTWPSHVCPSPCAGRTHASPGRCGRHTSGYHSSRRSATSRDGSRTTRGYTNPRPLSDPWPFHRPQGTRFCPNRTSPQRDSFGYQLPGLPAGTVRVHGR